MSGLFKSSPVSGGISIVQSVILQYFLQYHFICSSSLFCDTLLCWREGRCNSPRSKQSLGLNLHSASLSVQGLPCIAIALQMNLNKWTWSDRQLSVRPSDRPPPTSASLLRLIPTENSPTCPPKSTSAPSSVRHQPSQSPTNARHRHPRRRAPARSSASAPRR